MQTVIPLFVALYLVVDIIYVTLSGPVYQRVVQRIQGKPMQSMSPRVLASAMMAYGAMALAWAFFVPITTQYLVEKKRWNAVGAAALSGFILGVAIYFVFNFTNSVMFEKYDTPIIIRDIVWGTSWLTILSAMYGYVVLRKKT